jgi:hypothetical protein
VTIRQNVERILRELPPGVQLVAAAKAQGPEAIREAIEGGAAVIGENYVQEAEAARRAISLPAAWHGIGHLQKNKVKKAVALFDMIETVDSLEIAQEIDRRCAQAGKVMPVLVEINSGRELQKSGVLPEDAERLVRAGAALPNIKVMGLMTVGPVTGRPEDARPGFALTRGLFEAIGRLNLPNVEMQYLSMGMSDSYRMAIEEGANIVRIGRLIFGERPG